MKTILHDLDNDIISKFKFNEDDIVINSCECKNSCIGCFSCWTKTPTKCTLKDNFSNMTDYLKKSDDFIIISKNRYGCYSENIKRVLERCIGYVLPYFTIRDNHIHHKLRYNKKLNFITYFYGDIDKNDEICLNKLVKANSINLGATNYKVICKDVEEIKNVYFN